MASDSSDVEFKLDLSPDEWEQETYEYLDSGKDSLNILTVGKLGVGKSSLVNSVLGTHLAKEATSAESITPHITPYTTRIPVPLETTSKFVDVNVWDTPGLGDAFSENDQDAVLEKCKDGDVILYCMDMRQRLSRDDSTGITELISQCGPEIVKNTVFALTFGNDLKPPPNSKVEPCAFFSNTLESWQNAIVKLLKKRHVPEDILADIAIVPTGYKCHDPPDHTNWLDTFNSHVFNRIKDNAKPALAGISLNRLVWREDTSRIELIVPEELEPPLLRSAEPGPPLPRPAEPGPPLPRPAEPGPPLPRSAEPGPPLPRSAEPGQVLQRSVKQVPPVPRPAHHSRDQDQHSQEQPLPPWGVEAIALSLLGGPIGGGVIGGIVGGVVASATAGSTATVIATAQIVVVETAAVGTAAVGTAAVGTAAAGTVVGTAAVGTAAAGTVVGTATVGTAAAGTVVASATAGTAAAGTVVASATAGTAAAGTVTVGTATASTVVVSTGSITTGVVIGAATGAIVGLGVGALIAYAIYKYVKNKREQKKEKML